MPMTRRELLQATAVVSLASLGTGAGCEPDCGPLTTVADGPLTIDTHAHVFNATDLQVRDFIGRVGGRQVDGGLSRVATYFGEVLQGFAWNVAPTAQQELNLLNGLPRFWNRGGCWIVDSLRQQQELMYRLGVEQLKARAREMNAVRSSARGSWESASSTEKGLWAIEDLPNEMAPQDMQPLTAEVRSVDEPERASVRSALEFLVSMFQPRYVSALELMQVFGSEERRMDLIVPSLVDYDFWLSKGSGARSSLGEQMAVMEKIAQVTVGRVHPFVPFCPFREAQYQADGSTFSSLAYVKSCVEEQGAIGVKLYPPMGFAALGNADKDIWRQTSDLPPLAAGPEFGRKLDQALQSLYAYCSQNDVPIMAHTNQSNGPSVEFEQLAGPAYWKRALEEYPTLRISFGHFGTLTPRGDVAASAVAFLELMSIDSGAMGERAYADSSYFAEVLGEAELLENALVELFQRDTQTKRVLSQRLMFGSDWKMLRLENEADTYLRRFDELTQRVARRLDPGGDASGLRERLFGANAADFLGLRRGEKNRERLEAFYARSGLRMSEIPWVSKVDRL